jgi:UDP-N-acetylmuramoyl-tripeptide--D-alanyl-D-alanine ligase
VNGEVLPFDDRIELAAALPTRGRCRLIRMTLDEIAAVTGGRLVNADPAGGHRPGRVRLPAGRPGGLFVAFEGEKVDGHDFAGRAWRGRGRVLGTRDTGRPASWWRIRWSRWPVSARVVIDRLPASPSVGLTGSSGKTTDRRTTSASCSAGSARRWRRPGSLNNELGHPYTVLKATPETRLPGAGDGRPRDRAHPAPAQVAPPRIGRGAEHRARRTSASSARWRAPRRPKGELVEALPADRHRVLNADDPLVAAMAGRTDRGGGHGSASRPVPDRAGHRRDAGRARAGVVHLSDGGRYGSP